MHYFNNDAWVKVIKIFVFIFFDLNLNSYTYIFKIF